MPTPGTGLFHRLIVLVRHAQCSHQAIPGFRAVASSPPAVTVRREQAQVVIEVDPTLSQTGLPAACNRRPTIWTERGLPFGSPWSLTQGSC